MVTLKYHLKWPKWQDILQDRNPKFFENESKGKILPPSKWHQKVIQMDLAHNKIQQPNCGMRQVW